MSKSRFTQTKFENSQFSYRTVIMDHFPQKHSKNTSFFAPDFVGKLMGEAVLKIDSFFPYLPHQFRISKYCYLVILSSNFENFNFFKIRHQMESGRKNGPFQFFVNSFHPQAKRSQNIQAKIRQHSSKIASCRLNTKIALQRDRHPDKVKSNQKTKANRSALHDSECTILSKTQIANIKMFNTRQAKLFSSC